MSAVLTQAVTQITGILGKIAELSSDYNEAMRLMEGLSGALVVLTEFIQRRIGDGNAVDPQAMAHMLGTLSAIDAKIEEIHVTLGKKAGCIPYGKWYVYGAPLTGACFGRIGSTKLIKDLHDLEGDLSGDIKFLELQMTANAVQSLSALSSVQAAITKVFQNRSARDFWITSFGEEFTAKQDAVADRLVSVLREIREQHNDSDLSRASKLCAFLAADLARAATVGVRDFAETLGDSTVESWIRGSVEGKARTVLVPGHVGAVKCMACKEGFLVTGGEDGTVKVFALSATGVPMHRSTLVGHNDPVTCVDVCEGTGIVVSASRDGFVRTWSLYSGEKLGCYPVSGSVKTMTCSNGRIVYACDAPTMSINVMDAGTGSVVSKMYGHPGGVASLASAGKHVYSSGADRAVKHWKSPGHEHVDMLSQAHSIAVKFVVLHRDTFLATVSNKDIRFYDPRDINGTGTAVKLSERMEGGGSVAGACAIDDEECLVVVTSEPFADGSNSRIHAVFPKDDGTVRFDTQIQTAKGEAPCSVASYGILVYVGFTSGQVKWYRIDASEFVPLGTVGPAMAGTPPVLADVTSLPLLTCNDGQILTAHPPDTICFHPSGKKVKLEKKATAIARAETEAGGWIVACSDSLLIFDAEGEQKSSYAVDGEVVSLQTSKTRRKVFLDIRRKGTARCLSVFESRSGIVNDLVCEPCAHDATCAPGLVLNERYLVWPGYFQGTLAVMDTVELRTYEPVKFSHLEVDPVSAIATSKTWFVTLHGGLDVLVWNDIKTGPSCRLKTFMNPVTSVCITPSDRLVAGCADGTMFVDEEDSEVYVGHALGPVSTAVDAAGGSSFYSLGVEGSLVKHSLR